MTKPTTMLAFIQSIIATTASTATKRKRSSTVSKSHADQDLVDWRDMIAEDEQLLTIQAREKATLEPRDLGNGNEGEEQDEERRRKRRNSLEGNRRDRLSTIAEGREEDGHRQSRECSCASDALLDDTHLARTDDRMRMVDEDLWTWKGGSSLQR